MHDPKRCGCAPIPVRPICTCGHLEQSHNLSGKGERVGCSVSSGPKGTPCGCRRYETAEVTP